MNRELLDAVPLWGLLRPVSYSFGSPWRADTGWANGGTRVPQEKDAPVGAMVAAILGLLAFLPLATTPRILRETS